MRLRSLCAIRSAWSLGMRLRCLSRAGGGHISHRRAMPIKRQSESAIGWETHETEEADPNTAYPAAAARGSPAVDFAIEFSPTAQCYK